MSQYCEQTKRIKFDSASAASTYLHSDQHVEQCKHCGYFHIVCDRPSSNKNNLTDETIKEVVKLLINNGYLIYSPNEKETVLAIVSSYLDLRKKLKGIKKVVVDESKN